MDTTHKLSKFLLIIFPLIILVLALALTLPRLAERQVIQNRAAESSPPEVVTPTPASFCLSPSVISLSGSCQLSQKGASGFKQVKFNCQGGGGTFTLSGPCTSKNTWYQVAGAYCVYIPLCSSTAVPTTTPSVTKQPSTTPPPTKAPSLTPTPKN